jgi:iron complex outermembrane receptor protein
MRGMMWNSHQWSDVTYSNPQIQTMGGTRLLTGGALVNLEPIVRNDYNTARTRWARWAGTTSTRDAGR